MVRGGAPTSNYSFKLIILDKPLYIYYTNFRRRFFALEGGGKNFFNQTKNVEL